MKEWKVYFSGNFLGHEKGERRSKEISVEKSFFWGEKMWRVPSIYTSPAGLVVDFCVEIAPERIQAFMEKWNLWSGEPAACEDDEWQQAEAENPLSIGIYPHVSLNGRELLSAHWCSVSWNPCVPEEAAYDMTEARTLMEYYGCDASKGWVFIRSAFRWETKRKPVLRKMKLRLEREPQYFAGEHFTADTPGQEKVFTHPVTGVRHTLTVKGVTQEKLKKEPFGDDREWPTHYIKMEYALSPDLPDREFTIQDCACADAPRQKQKKAAALSVIGGADGPTAIFIAGKEKGRTHAAFSSLHFEKVETVEWKMSFHVKTCEDIEVGLL